MTKAQPRKQKFSRRQFLTYKALMTEGVEGVDSAVQRVDRFAAEHPEVDMDEEFTWAEWKDDSSVNHR